MRKLLIAALAAATMATSALAGFGTAGGSAEPVYLKGSDGIEHQFVMGTASSTGSYYKAGKRLSSMLGYDREANVPFLKAETTDGTGQNFDLMESGIVNIILAQGDMVAYQKAKFPNFFKNKTLIKLDRTEDVQLIMREGMDEDDLQSKKATVHVGLQNSGGSGSWVNIVQLEKNYGKANVVYGPINIGTLQQLADGEITAIVRTSHISPKNDQLARDVVKHKGIYFADFDDSDLNDKIDFGNGSKAIYEFEDTVVSTKGFFNTEAETLRTGVYLIIDNKNMNSNQLNKILRAISGRKLF